MGLTRYIALLLAALTLSGCGWMWTRDNPCDDPAGGGFCLSAGGPLSDYGKDIVVAAGGSSHVVGSFAGIATFGHVTLSARGSASPDAPTGGGQTADMFVAQVSPSGQIRWAVSAGGDTADYGNGVATDSGGNVYVTGSFTGTASFGTHVRTATGLHDVFVAQLSPTGQFNWVVKAGGAHNDYCNDVAVDSAGNTYVMGSFYKSAVFGATKLTAHGPSSFDVFVAQVSPSGKFRWAVSAGGSKDDYGNGIAVDSAGNSYITGIFVGNVAFGAAGLASRGALFDLFVAQVSPQGKFRWAVSAGGGLMDFGNDVAVDSGGNVYVTGEFAGAANFGSFTLNARGSHDVFVGKVSHAGGVKGRFDWVVSAGGDQHDYGKGIAVDSGGSIYLTGEFTENAVFGDTTLRGPAGMFYAAKVSPTGAGGKGAFSWATTAGDNGAGRGNRIAVDAAGNNYVTGQLTSQGEGDVLIWKVGK